MEDGLREILKAHYGEMMENITEPQYLAYHIKVLTPIDLERIETERRGRGESAGVFELLNRLQKRGHQAFPQLIAALKNNGNQAYTEIAVKLEKEAIRSNLYRRPIAVKIPIARGPWPSERPVSAPIQQPSINKPHALGEEEMHSAKPTPPSTIKIQNPEDFTKHEEVNSKQLKNKGKGPWPSERPVSTPVQQPSINQPHALGEEEMHSAKPTPPSTIKIQNPEDLTKHEEVNSKQLKNKGKVPPEIIARGPKAQAAYQQALKEGKVQVYRGRIMLIGQDRAGKTSLKKSLLGLKFEADEPSTVGVAVDPSSFSVAVHDVISWKKLEDSPRNDFEDNIARIIADRLRKSHENPGQNPGLKDGDRNVKDSDDNYAVGNGEINDQTKCDELETATSLAQNGAGNHPSEEVIENLMKYLSGKKLDDVSSEDKVIVSFWDFAGQQLYYASHPVFFSPRAVYLLVYNMNKDLKADAQPCVRQGVCDINLDNHEKQTNLESILSWLVSVHCVRPDGNGRNKDVKDLPYLQPPVIIVGTHADCPFEASAKMEAIIHKSLGGKSYNKHVATSFITVDNRSADDKGITKVKEEVKKLFNMEPYMGEYIPVRWLMFEKAIKSLVEEKGICHLPLNDLEEIVREVCQIENKDEMAAMLNFYHDLGVVVKHGNTVVLEAEWLIDLFKRLITIKPFQEQIPLQRSYWDKLENEGILDIGLVEHVFNDLLKSEGSETKEDILTMMEKYALIARFGTPKDFHFFVPVQLQSSPGELLDVEPTELDPWPLFFEFPDGFIPHGMYHCLVSKVIAWCSENKYLQKPNLYRNVSQFFIGCSFEYELLLICRKPFIKVVLRSLQGQRSSEFQPAFSVRKCLENCLAVLKKECHGYCSIWYQISVLCQPCSRDDRKCDKHKQGKCRDDECLHLLPVNNDRVLLCKTTSTRVSEDPRLEEWYTDHLKSTELHRTELEIDDGEQSGIAICPDYFACIEVHELATISAVKAAEKIAEWLLLDKTSLNDPPAETVKKCRRFCVNLKQKGRLDIVKTLRTTIPSGMTGPLLDENELYERFDSGKRKLLTRSLCGDESWKLLVEELGISKSCFPFYDRKGNPVEAILEEVCKERRLTVGDVYDIIVKCGAAALADEYL